MASIDSTNNVGFMVKGRFSERDVACASTAAKPPGWCSRRGLDGQLVLGDPGFARGLDSRQVLPVLTSASAAQTNGLCGSPHCLVCVIADGLCVTVRRPRRACAVETKGRE